MGLTVWKFDYFRQNIWRGQICFGTSIFGQFCILMIYKHLITCDKYFQLEAHNMKIDLFSDDFEMVRLIREPRFSVSFCIFPTCYHIPADD